MDAHVKAVPVNSLVRFVEQEIRPEQLRDIIAKFPPGEAAYLSGKLLANEQVPLTPVNRFTHLAAEAKGEPVKSFGRRAGHFSAEQGLRSVYKFIMIMMSVETVLKKAPFMWTRVYDRGSLDIESTSNTAKIHLRNFPVADEAGCARITGWFEKIGETAGAKDLHVEHATCAASGGSACRWDFTWKN